MNTTASRDFTKPLTVSAIALLALIAFQASARFPQVGRSSTASAGMVSSVGGYTILTSNAGNEDILLVLDSRNEELNAYRTEHSSAVQLYEKVALPQLFTSARASTAPTK